MWEPLQSRLQWGRGGPPVEVIVVSRRRGKDAW